MTSMRVMSIRKNFLTVYHTGITMMEGSAPSMDTCFPAMINSSDPSEQSIFRILFQSPRKIPQSRMLGKIYSIVVWVIMRLRPDNLFKAEFIYMEFQISDFGLPDSSRKSEIRNLKSEI